MRIDMFRGDERRAARMHWLREVLNKETAARQEAVFDDVLRCRFWAASEIEGVGTLPSLP